MANPLREETVTDSATQLTPQYLLFSQVSKENKSQNRWRFVLDQINGDDRFEASDFEEGVSIERLQLLSIIRGLEAIDEPAQVTIVTSSQYVSRGIKQGIHQWRQNEWKWERFGEMIPVRDCDLWKKIQRATAVHRVDCRFWNMNSASACVEADPTISTATEPIENQQSTVTNRQYALQPLKQFRLLATYIQEWISRCMAKLKTQFGQFKLQSPIYRVSTD